MSKATRRKLRRRNGCHVHPVAHVSLAPSPWDHGATGQANRVGLVVEERGEADPKTGRVTNPNGVTGVRRVDMLEVYWKRGVITDRGYAAGQLLRAAWLRTEMGQGSPWLRDRVDSSPKPDVAIAISIDRISALARVNRLVAAEDDEVIGIVCRDGAGVGGLRRYRGLRHEEGLTHLREGLDRLADRMERGR